MFTWSFFGLHRNIRCNQPLDSPRPNSLETHPTLYLMLPSDHRCYWDFFAFQACPSEFIRCYQKCDHRNIRWLTLSELLRNVPFTSTLASTPSLGAIGTSDGTDFSVSNTATFTPKIPSLGWSRIILSLDFIYHFYGSIPQNNPRYHGLVT